MAAPKDQPRNNPCGLTAGEDSTLTAHWPMRRIRFLLSDGRTVDVLTDRDDSDLRGAILAYTGVERLEGHTEIKP